MLFTSPLFLFFFIAVLAGFHLVRWMEGRKDRSPMPIRSGSGLLPSQSFLLVASLVFYSGWEFPRGLWFLPLLVGTSALDWWAGRLLYSLPRRRHALRRTLLIFSLMLNLGALCLFKYLGFFATTLNDLSAAFGSDWEVAVPRLILPLGISFFTFQSMSYTIDAWRRRGRPYRSLSCFLFFVTFFPQLIAGPIVRAEQFRREISARRDTGWAALSEGLKIAVVGLFLKVAVGDSLAVRLDPLYQGASSLTPLDTLGTSYGFCLQLYCDFAGYSLIAIGMARCFGFRLPRNFDLPLLAVGMRDRWKRWHMTLSTWLRDYLYIPLGGSRHGPVRSTIALSATMFLGGLWHGASWQFVVWGVFHGFVLAFGRVFRHFFPAIGKWQETTGKGRLFTWLFTLQIQVISLLPFRAHSMSDAWNMFLALFEAPGAILGAMASGWAGTVHQETILLLPFMILGILFHVFAIGGWRLLPRVIWSTPIHREPHGERPYLNQRTLHPEDAILLLRPVPAGIAMGALILLVDVCYVGSVNFVYFAF